MNFHPIITPNTKGQLVIPVAIRKKLKLKPSSPLQVSTIGDQIILKPVYGVKTAVGDNAHYLELVKSTQGSWANDPDSHQANHEFELEASRKRQKAW
jgi:AbrB family looped-hinge helix DNA binding protein